MDAPSAPATSLTNKLQRISELAEKLIYVKWSKEFFVLLLRALREVPTPAPDQPQQQRIAGLAQAIAQQISTCLEQGDLPQGAERERLLAMLSALCSATAERRTSSTTQRPIDTITTPLFSQAVFRLSGAAPANRRFTAAPLLWLVGAESAGDLLRKLQQRAGFETRLCADMSEVGALLARDLAPAERPLALLVDLDATPDLQATFAASKALQPLLAPYTPLFFCTDRSDISARVQAVRAGASGYFTKPLDLPMLLEKLNQLVLQPLNQRVLLVDDQLSTARELARLLESRGMVVQVLAQPQQILPTLRDFQPNLLILSLDLAEVSGLDLGLAIQQHEAFHDLPQLLLSEQVDRVQALAATALNGEALLGRPPEQALLLAAIARRLRQTHGLHNRFSQLSHRDTVSGLYNRPYFLAYVERLLATTAVNGQLSALMLIALDNLSQLESQDVAAADEVVEQAAQRLQTTLGTAAMAARFSDAVFAVLLSFANQAAVPATAKALQGALETAPYQLATNQFQLRTSIGVSIVTAQMRETDLLIQQADLACDMARNDRNTRICIHQVRDNPATDSTDNSQQRRILEEIREAVQQQRMTLLFQPVVSLRGDASERYEVLLRIRNSEGRELLPETVFGLVRRNRIGMVLDRWVIAHSMRILRERQMRGQHAILFINLSPTIAEDTELLNWLASGLEKTGVNPAALVFEIAENSAGLHQESFKPFLREMKALGCGISLDHATGMERSLQLAQQLNVDYLKLETRFAHQLREDKTRQQELIQLARKLSAVGITIIVTGVEDAATLPALWGCGIDFVQGFFLQRPHTDMSYDFAQTIV